MKIKSIANFLNRAIKADAKRWPDFVIGNPEDPYMLRWFIIPRNRFFNIYLHQVLKDDDDRALHDHPWASLSIMLEGELTEIFAKSDGETLTSKKLYREIKQGQIVYRRGKFAHRLMVRNGEAKTLFITGPRFRKWGFYCDHSWRFWRDFTNSENTGEVGRGCE